MGARRPPIGAGFPEALNSRRTHVDDRRAMSFARVPCATTSGAVLTTSFSADARLTRLVRTVAGAVVVAVAAVAAGPVPASPADASASFAIGSYNIRANVSTGTFDSAVHAVMASTDVAGLQEVNRHEKEDVLRSLAQSGWSYYRGPQGQGEQVPVIWNAARFDQISAGVARIADARYIGNELPRVSSVNANYATLVRLRDRMTGAAVTVINVHLVPGAVINGQPTPGRPRLLAAYKQAVANLASLARSEGANGRVFVLGDFNVGWVADKRFNLKPLPFATFWRQSMRSMWATQRPSGGIGSHEGSPALIDQVYSPLKATSATVRYDVRFSDHFPVIATYTV